MEMSTVSKERFKCLLPLKEEDSSKSAIDQYFGPSAKQLLQKEFAARNKLGCSYRVRKNGVYFFVEIRTVARFRGGGGICDVFVPFVPVISGKS